MPGLAQLSLKPLVEDTTTDSYTYYVPMPDAKSAKVTLSGPGSIYWQTDWTSLPAGTRVTVLGAHAGNPAVVAEGQEAARVVMNIGTEGARFPCAVMLW